MASSSSLSSPIQKKKFKYDVFISFRGEDTRKNFVAHLYAALQSRGISTYKDDNFLSGKTMNDERFKAIEDSRFIIVVFSENYAASSWCLDELVKIMECRNTTGKTVFPVYYYVEPSEVRRQKGAFGQVFALAESEMEKSAGIWRETLTDAAKLSGWQLSATANGDEAEFVRNIVTAISQQLFSVNRSIDENLVGMETRMKDVISSLESGLNDVQMIGIKGMGGAGKTTLARVIFDWLSIEFEAKSFVENVREVSKKSLSGLKSLQEKVLSDLLNDQQIIIKSVHDGKDMIKMTLHDKKVLIVLDDIDSTDQLEALAGKPNWFKPGSIIIITTRDEHVLIVHGVKVIHDVNLLSDKEAMCLFSRYAFGKDTPVQEYENLSLQIVLYAAGLPLTIKVLGSFLNGKDKSEWIDAVARLKTIPLKATLKVLELSYESLDDDDKELFLDVACFLKGWDKDKAITLLESCGFYARIGLKVLKQKSLIRLTKTFQAEHIDMHILTEEMGKNIVRHLHPDEPNRHSRLWNQDDIEYVLANELDTKAIKAIAVDTPVKPWSQMVTKGFGSLKRLRSLCMISEIDYDCDVKNDEVSLSFPDTLRFLSWVGYPHWSLPKTFEAKNLVALEMPHSRIRHTWEGGERKVFYNLKSIDLSHSKLRTLDLGLTPNLEALNLEECHYLKELHMSIGCLKLRTLMISHSKLTTLDLGLTPNLEVFKLKECHDLKELHMPVKFLQLRSLDLSHLKLSTFDLRLTPNLEKLSLGECYDLIKLDMPIEFAKLTSLELRHSKLSTFDLSLTPILENLSLEVCHDLVELHMPADCPKLTSLNLRRLNLCTLDLGSTPNLEMLIIQDCYHLAELHTPLGCLKRLFFLDISGCSKLDSFSFINQLESLEILCLTRLYLKEFPDVILRHRDNVLFEFRFGYNDIDKLPSSIANLQELQHLDLHSCRKLTSLPETICGLRHLRKLKLYGCSLKELPEDIGKLECLEKLNLSFTCIKHLPDSICKLRSLSTLNLSSCWNLEKLPQDIGSLESLQKLILEDCSQVRDIPDSICELKCLEYFSVLDCIQLQKLPEELGDLQCLKELNIEGTRIRYLPSSISLLTDLKIYGPKSGTSFSRTTMNSRKKSALQNKDSEKLQKLKEQIH